MQLQVPPPLSASDKSSFAYKTIKDRLPVILVKTIDFLHRQRKELHKFGGTLESPSPAQIIEIENDAKSVITEITKIRKDVETNKAATFLQPIDNLGDEFSYFNDDIEQWNKALEENKLEDGSLPRWFDSAWLLVECYMYRKIKEAFLKTKNLKMFDPFVEEKQAACKSSLSQMLAVASYLKDIERQSNEKPNQRLPVGVEQKEFNLFIQLALWANKCDLSLSGMSANNVESQQLSDIRGSIENLYKNILCENMRDLFYCVQSVGDEVRKALRSEAPSEKILYIDLVADNAGYEIFVDFCLLHYIALMMHPKLSTSGAVKFRVHLKRMPWFVSDTLKQDIDLLLDYMTGSSQDATLRDLGNEWRTFISNGFWELHQDKFWTLPYDYSQMPEESKELYSSLQESKLIIFKGDLNYRKLVGDRKWHLLTPFKAALRKFCPAPLVALRTNKADVVVGIEDINVFAKINNNELPRDWMISGNYGLIQFVGAD